MTDSRYDKQIKPSMAAMADHVKNHKKQGASKRLSKAEKALLDLEQAEDSLRSANAILIAERVERSRLEAEIASRDKKAQGYKGQLASATEALRRLKDEALQASEERRRFQAAYEAARAK